MAPFPEVRPESGEGLRFKGTYSVRQVLQTDQAQLSQSARENYSRPSIDKPFRSAASTAAVEVIGVLLAPIGGGGGRAGTYRTHRP